MTNKQTMIFFSLSLSFKGSIKRFAWIYRFVCFPSGHKELPQSPSRIVLGVVGCSLCHNDCNGMLRKCTSHIANKLHNVGTVHSCSIVHARSNDISCTARNCNVSCRGNGSRVLSSNNFRITNTIRFHCMQWRSLRGYDHIHGIRIGRHVFPWTNYSTGLCIHRSAALQYLSNIWVSIDYGLNVFNNILEWRF